MASLCQTHVTRVFPSPLMSYRFFSVSLPLKGVRSGVTALSSPLTPTRNSTPSSPPLVVKEPNGAFSVYPAERGTDALTVSCRVHCGAVAAPC